MSNSITSNKRIAKNTLFLYFRMIIIMLVSLYTSRVVLNELGIEDYGVYTVVGGVVTMFSFLNSSMTSSTQRYLNFEIGQSGENSPKLRTIFSTALTIHIVIAIIVVALAETLGLWFVNTKLVIPQASRLGANIVYQAAIFSFCSTILRVPFNAAIIAHERMSIYAVISILEAIFLLGSAYLLILVTNKLAVYGCLTCGVHLIIAICFIVICLRSFKECTLRLIYISSLFKEMLKFAAWNVFGSIAWIARNQGVGIVLNIFFGPILNAAKGVADQVYSAINSLTGNFQLALNPQITKNYAQNNIEAMELLAYRGIKFSCILVWLMSLPIIVNVDTILHLWLTDVPEYAPLFVILILFDCFSSALFGNPLMISISATGKVRAYQIVVSSILLLILPISYIGLRYGLPPESIFYLNILFNVLAGIVRLGFCHRQLHYSFTFYFKYALLPVLVIVILSLLILLTIRCYLVSDTTLGSVPDMVILVSTALFVVSMISWCIGLNRQERRSILLLVKSRINKNER